MLIGQAADLAADPVLPDGVTLRRVTARSDLQAHRRSGEHRLGRGLELARRRPGRPGRERSREHHRPRRRGTRRSRLRRLAGVQRRRRLRRPLGRLNAQGMARTGHLPGHGRPPSPTRCCPRCPLRLRRCLSRQPVSNPRTASPSPAPGRDVRPGLPTSAHPGPACPPQPIPAGVGKPPSEGGLPVLPPRLPAAAEQAAVLLRLRFGRLPGRGFLCLPAKLLLALAFVGFRLLLCCDGPALAVLTQVLVRLRVAGVPHCSPPLVGELRPAVRARRPPRLPRRGLLFLAAPLLFSGGLAAAGEVRVPAGVADRVVQRLQAVAVAAVAPGSAGPAGPCSRSRSRVVATMGIRPS
ncbi:hypothetical protein SBADM41S_00038 [Streptomyces badius]